jgi:hypothetical protein
MLISVVFGEITQGHLWHASFIGRFVFPACAWGAYASLAHMAFETVKDIIREANGTARGKECACHKTIDRFKWLNWLSLAAAWSMVCLSTTSYHEEAALAKRTCSLVAWGVALPCIMAIQFNGLSRVLKEAEKGKRSLSSVKKRYLAKKLVEAKCLIALGTSFWIFFIFNVFTSKDSAKTSGFVAYNITAILMWGIAPSSFILMKIHLQALHDHLVGISALARHLRELPRNDAPDNSAAFYGTKTVACVGGSAMPSVEAKIAVLEQLTPANELLLDVFFEHLPKVLHLKRVASGAEVTSRGKIQLRHNRKTRESILAKANRPEILARNPQYGIEHVRDSFR